MTGGKPTKDREKARRLLVHYQLRQLSPSDQSWLEQQLAAFPDLREELQAVERTIGVLRQAPELRPSPRFRAVLEHRLDQVDEEDASGRRRRDSLRFRMLLVGHRLRTSPRLRLQLAAGLLPFFVGLGWVLMPKESAQETVDPWQAATVASPQSENEPPLVRDPRLIVDEGALPRRDLDVPPPVLDSHNFQTTPIIPEMDLLPEGGGLAHGGAVEPTPIDLDRPTDVIRDPVAPAPIPEAWRQPTRRALRWMIAQQEEDGSWSPGDGEADLGVAVTALSLLAFVSDGHLGLSEGAEDRLLADQTVREAVNSLLRRQRHGVFGSTLDFATESFNHTTATLALVEHVSLALAAGADPAALEAERRAAIDGLDIIEARLRRLFAPGDVERSRRGEGENAAWAAMALATARRSGLDWGLTATIDRQVAAMFARLGDGPRSFNSATMGSFGHAAMMDVVGEVEFDEWAIVIGGLLADPANTEPGLRFLAASAMAPWRSSPSEANLTRWTEFHQRLEAGLLREQSPDFGWFDVRLRGSFDGGDVYNAALCVLTLQIPQRVEQLGRAAQKR